MSNSFFLDGLIPPITKRQLAAALGVSERSVFNYQVVATTSVDDFLSDYPVVNGKYITSTPMTYYQAWIIGHIKTFLDFFPNVKILQNKLENDPQVQQSWSKQVFLTEFPEYYDNTQSFLVKL